MRRGPFTLPKVLFLLLVLAAGTAGAQVDGDLESLERAKELFKKGEVHFSLGEFKKSLGLYREAYRVKPLAGFLFNIGQCYRNLGDCEKAIFYYKQYLSRMPEAPNAKDVETLIGVCVRSEARKTEAQRRKAEEARKKAEEERLAAELEREQAEKAAEAGQGKGLKKIWFWSAAGLSGAMLLTGTITGVMALSKNKEYKDSGTSVADRQDLMDSGKTLANVSTATFVIGGVAAAGTAVLYFFTDWSSEEKPAEVSAGLLPGGGSIVLKGRF
jgi:tetratricopeptide (TPR) repeat protein